MAGTSSSYRLGANIESVRAALDATNEAREAALPGCRRVIQLSGSAIKCVHRLQADRALAFADDAESVLREVQSALDGQPSVQHAGFLHDAEKEYVEARSVIALVAGDRLPSAEDLHVGGPAYLKGLAEAASELRRHLLDRLRDGELARGEELLGLMDEVYESLSVIDFPDAVTGGLRRTLDALRAVLERSRGDLTTTVLQTRLQHALETAAGVVADTGTG